MAVFENSRHGSVIQSWLIELMGKALKEGPPLEDVDAFVEDTGEVNWIVQ